MVSKKKVNAKKVIIGICICLVAFIVNILLGYLYYDLKSNIDPKKATVISKMSCEEEEVLYNNYTRLISIITVSRIVVPLIFFVIALKKSANLNFLKIMNYLIIVFNIYMFIGIGGYYLSLLPRYSDIYIKCLPNNRISR